MSWHQDGTYSGAHTCLLPWGRVCGCAHTAGPEKGHLGPGPDPELECTDEAALIPCPLVRGDLWRTAKVSHPRALRDGLLARECRPCCPQAPCGQAGCDRQPGWSGPLSIPVQPLCRQWTRKGHQFGLIKCYTAHGWYLLRPLLTHVAPSRACPRQVCSLRQRRGLVSGCSCPRVNETTR